MTAIDKLDDKYIVINKKRFDELNAIFHLNLGEDRSWRSYPADHPVIMELKKAIDMFTAKYCEVFGPEKIFQDYIVINQDEPYAEEVAEIVLRAGNSKDKEADDE